MLINAFSVFTPDVKAAPQQAAPAAEWLEQAYREGWAACRDAETIGEEAEDWAFGNSTANSRMIDMQQAAPQQVAPAECHHRPPCAECAALAKSRRRDNAAPQQEVQEPNNFGAPATCDSPALCSVSRVCAGQFGTKRLCKPTIWAAQPAPSGDAWKDGDTAALVNELRDAAVQYRDTQQLRERIAHIVRPLVGHVQNPAGNEHVASDVSKSGQESNMSDAEDAARALFDAGWKACARFCDREDAIFDGIVGNTGCPQFEAAYDAARKEGNKP